jgi:thiol-disulfide isomerase/thioredoxin/YHS domain-containing protein
MKSNMNNVSPRHGFKSLIVALSLLALCWHPSAEISAQITGGLQWQNDIEQAKEIARREDKLVLLHFGATWCRPCKSLDTYVFTSKSVQNAIAENVVPVKIDADENVEAVNKYDVQMVPYDVIISPEGRTLMKRRSPSDAENYSKMLRQLSSASRKLTSGSNGAIAHQMNTIQNKYVGQSKDFTPDAPSHEQFGLAKDGSLLKRRQTAFNDAANGTAKKQTNPWVAPLTQSIPKPETITGLGESIQFDDLERRAFLEKERYLASPSNVTRRAKPQRILNSQYFDAIAKRSEQGSAAPEQVASLVSPSTPIEPQQTAAVQTQPMQASHMRTASDFAIGTTDNDTADIASQESAFTIVMERPAIDAPPALRTPTENETLDSGATTNSLLTESTAGSKNDATSAELATDPGFQKSAAEPKSTQEAQASASPTSTANDATTALAASQTPKQEVDRKQFCLYGKCPVTLMQDGRWVDGDLNFGIVHRNRTYLFASAEKLAAFKADPDGLSPILAGYDPVVYHDEGRLVDGLAEHGVFMGKMPKQNVVLFTTPETRAKFQAQPKVYMNTIRQAMMKVTNEPLIR